jgi:hypothetical protein
MTTASANHARMGRRVHLGHAGDTPDRFIDVSHVPSGTYWVVEETIPARGHLPHRLSGDRTRAPEHPAESRPADLRRTIISGTDTMTS